MKMSPCNINIIRVTSDGKEVTDYALNIAEIVKTRVTWEEFVSMHSVDNTLRWETDSEGSPARTASERLGVDRWW